MGAPRSRAGDQLIGTGRAWIRIWRLRDFGVGWSGGKGDDVGGEIGQLGLFFDDHRRQIGDDAGQCGICIHSADKDSKVGVLRDCIKELLRLNAIDVVYRYVFGLLSCAFYFVVEMGEEQAVAREAVSL